MMVACILVLLKRVAMYAMMVACILVCSSVRHDGGVHPSASDKNTSSVIMIFNHFFKMCSSVRHDGGVHPSASKKKASA
ncbi:hypothetical protein PPACK8108_LOCUS15485, partial [Phakopsora pachyrhizi]